MQRSSEATDATLLRCVGLGKRFYFYEHRTSSLREWFIRAVLRKPIHVRRSLFVLTKLDLDLRRGEGIGIVGSNGSGKSTLLRLLAGIYEPTTGAVEAYGRVGTVIELGAGFHPELTGAENVGLYGATFGLSRREMALHYDGIVEFSGVGEFINTPVKYYSSGMKARLAFSVVTRVQPDILLLDEALAVGDQAFREKCVDWLHSFRSAGGALVISSHDLELLPDLCDRAIWLDRGAVKRVGDVEEVVRAYREPLR